MLDRVLLIGIIFVPEEGNNQRFVLLPKRYQRGTVTLDKPCSELRCSCQGVAGDGVKALGQGEVPSQVGSYANIFMNGGEVFKFAVRAVPTVRLSMTTIYGLLCTRTCAAREGGGGVGGDGRGCRVFGRLGRLCSIQCTRGVWCASSGGP